MEVIVGIILSLGFCYINYNILKSDLLYQKIPNIQLLYLLLIAPLAWYYIFVLGYTDIIVLQLFLLQTVIALAIGFILFHFGIWGAGDTKYLLILSILIPHIPITWLIFNISFITIIFLLGSFIYFWGKQVLLLKDVKEIYSYFKNSFLNVEGPDIKKNIFNGATYSLYFLLFFSVFRIIRIHLIDRFKNNDFSHTLLYSYRLYLTILFLATIILGILYILRHPRYHTFMNTYIRDGKNKKLLRYIFIGFFSFMLSFEYMLLGDTFFIHLKNVLSIYLGLYLVIQALLRMYKIFCLQSESQLIPVKKLKNGMIIEKSESNIPLSIYNKIHRKIGGRDIRLLKKNKVPNVYVRTTFSFGPYIFTGFICTLIFQNSLIIFLYDSLKILFR